MGPCRDFDVPRRSILPGWTRRVTAPWGKYRTIVDEFKRRQASWDFRVICQSKYTDSHWKRTYWGPRLWSVDCILNSAVISFSVEINDIRCSAGEHALRNPTWTSYRSENETWLNLKWSTNLIFIEKIWGKELKLVLYCTTSIVFRLKISLSLNPDNVTASAVLNLDSIGYYVSERIFSIDWMIEWSIYNGYVELSLYRMLMTKVVVRPCKYS